MRPIRLAAFLLGLSACAHDTGSTMTARDFSTQILLRQNRVDLLTGGLGLDGLRAGPPAFANPASPTWDEQRRLAIWGQWKGLSDLDPDNGYGTLYGRYPLDVHGIEILAELRVDGQRDSLVMLQIPENFHRKNACLVIAPSSGSRNVYGAVPTTGPWAYAHGCAVIYTDKGIGTGILDLDSGIAYDLPIPGLSADMPFPSRDDLAPADWRAAHPHRIATHHAHDKRNPEADWGRKTLRALRFALDSLQAEFPQLGKPKVIAASISNGGASSLRAAEEDRDGLIDAVAVAEPNLNLPDDSPNARLDGKPLPPPRPLYDYAAAMAVYLPCTLDPAACEAVKARGWLNADDIPAQQREARLKLREAGLQPTGEALSSFSYGIQLFPAILATYASAYARMTPAELPGVSFAATDAKGEALAIPATLATTQAALSGGVPPSAGIGLIYDRSMTDACLRLTALAPSFGGEQEPLGQRLAQGLAQIRVSGNLHGLPAIIVHGRADNLIPVNNSSRPYLALNHQQEGERSQLRYLEVENAQHFDAFMTLPALAQHYVPLQPYYEQALDRIWAHLFENTPLPDSQVINTSPKKAGSKMTRTNIPLLDKASRKIPMTSSGPDIPE